MKKILFFLIFCLIFQANLTTPTLGNITDQLQKLNKLYQNGSISAEEYKKAKSIVLEMEQNKKEKLNKAKKHKETRTSVKEIEIKKYKENVGQETMELIKSFQNS